jgi:Peptidase A4 family
MKAQDTFAKLGVLAALGILLVTLTTVATAESEAARVVRASAATVPTNIPGIRSYAEPPKGFNPLMATDVELATYGFPPRPDQEAEPDRYAVWERAMKAVKIRWNGELKPLSLVGHRAIPAASSNLPEAVHPEVTGPKQISTNSASGVVLTNKLTSWNGKTSFSDITSEFTVPKAQFPFNNTSCTTDYTEFSYIGIDGFVFDSGLGDSFAPMVQAGVYADVPCSGAPFYYAMLSWRDSLSGVFPVNPGDDVLADMSVVGGPSGTASVFLFDFTTSTSGSYAMSTPGLVGNSADWIVERLCCTSADQLFPLANTSAIAFNEASAETGNLKVFYPGSQASSTEVLTMTNDGFNQVIEAVDQGSGGYQGLHSLWFVTTGCAYDGGCTP